MFKVITLAIRTITAVLKANPQKIVKGKLFKTLSKYGGTALTQQISSATQVAKLASNPQKLIGVLRKASKQEINEILKEVESFEKGNFRDKIKEITEDIKQSKQLAKSEVQNLKDLEQDIKGNFTKGIDRKYLSSSWLKYGEYTQLGNTGLGNLTIRILQDGKSKWYGPYTYPAVPKLVWDNMKSAVGKNGTGAGSVFWKMFLGHWLPSNLRDYVKKHQDKITGNDLKEVNKNIQELSNRYYNKKSVKENRYSNLLDNKKYQQHYRTSLKEVKDLKTYTKSKNQDNIKVLREEKQFFKDSKKPTVASAKSGALEEFGFFRKTDYKVGQAKRSFNKSPAGKIKKASKKIIHF